MSNKYLRKLSTAIFPDSTITKDERTERVIRASKVLSNKLFEYGVLLLAAINSLNGSMLFGLELVGLWYLVRLVSFIYQFINQAVYSNWVKESLISFIISTFVAIIFCIGIYALFNK